MSVATPNINAEKIQGNLSINSVSATTYFNLPSTTFTGGTVNGPTNFTSGLTANTISATTYFNLPSALGDYLPLSGGTVTGGTIFQSGLTANTISATTYQNLPNTLYTGDGVLTGNRTVFLSSNTLTFSSSTSSNLLVLSGNNIGIGTSSPKTLLQVGNGGGNMLYPYEQLVVENNGDTKLSIYTSVSSPSSGGASLSLGYSNFLTDSNLYPGFEFQHYGSVFSTGNYIRYNFIQRDALGDVSIPDSKQDLFSIYSDGSVIINSPDVNSKLGIGILESHISNTLHVSANTNPVRFEGLSSSTTDSSVITIDNDGVLHTYPLSNLTGE